MSLRRQRDDKEYQREWKRAKRYAEALENSGFVSGNVVGAGEGNAKLGRAVRMMQIDLYFARELL